MSLGITVFTCIYIALSKSKTLGPIVCNFAQSNFYLHYDLFYQSNFYLHLIFFHRCEGQLVLG